MNRLLRSLPFNVIELVILSRIVGTSLSLTEEVLKRYESLHVSVMRQHMTLIETKDAIIGHDNINPFMEDRECYLIDKTLLNIPTPMKNIYSSSMKVTEDEIIVKNRTITSVEVLILKKINDELYEGYVMSNNNYDSKIQLYKLDDKIIKVSCYDDVQYCITCKREYLTYDADEDAIVADSAHDGVEDDEESGETIIHIRNEMGRIMDRFITHCRSQLSN